MVSWGGMSPELAVASWKSKGHARAGYRCSLNLNAMFLLTYFVALNRWSHKAPEDHVEQIDIARPGFGVRGTVTGGYC
jgi:hypothetical protein